MTPTPRTKTAYSVAEAAAETGMSTKAIRAAIRAGQLRHVKVGTRFFVSQKHLNEFFEDYAERVAS